MNSSTHSRKPHAVCVPYPSQGHVTPMMHLSKLLHSRGFHVTFVNTEFNHRRLVRSRGPDSVEGLPDFRFETIPDGLPPSDRLDATQDVPALCDSTRKNCLAPFVALLRRLLSATDVPPVTCVVSDGVMSFGMEAAREIGVPEVQFWTASACSFLGYLHFRELIRRGMVSFKDESFTSNETLDTPVHWIPGLTNIRFKDLPSFLRTTNPAIMFDFMGEEAQKCLEAPAIVFNTFDALELEVLGAIAAKHPRIYTVGPLPLLCRRQVTNPAVNSLNPSLWKEEPDCVEWLDRREPGSVVYVNYGSVAVMTAEQLREFAWGLANSRRPFLWIVRPDVVIGDSAALPEEFWEEIEERGRLARWCDQAEVVAHPSVGAFLTHCGWNSVVEAVCGGVPVICWPFFADQFTNCRYACENWGIGVEVDGDVKRGNVEALVREVMEGDGGKEMRRKAREWKKKAEEATDVGGSSHSNFDRLVKEALGYEG